MPFPDDDRYWVRAADVLLRHWGEDVELVGPPDFVQRFPRTIPYDVMGRVDWRQVEAFVLHKGCMADIPEDCLMELDEKWEAVFSNEVFVIFRPGRSWFRSRWSTPLHELNFRRYAAELREKPALSLSRQGKTVLLVTTYNRPEFLRSTLESLSVFSLPMLVVDDGSDPVQAARNREVVADFPAQLLTVPENRGLPNALNTGLAYWLADPEVEWISYFQDDVEVRADAMEWMMRVQHEEKRPLLSGRYDPLHKTLRWEECCGTKVAYQRSCPGIHLHGHRAYWEGVMPIPTPYLGAPKFKSQRAGRGADEDFWITSWAPRSLAKRGLAVCVVPDLVRTRAHRPEDSTWSSPAFEEVAALGNPTLPPAGAVVHWWPYLAARHPVRVEAEAHPHAAEARAGLYHSPDGGSTELEVLQFLVALVCLFKPRNLLETGSYQGYGTLSLASGVRTNGFGQITSLEKCPEFVDRARRLLNEHDPRLASLVSFVEADSVGYLKHESLKPFDFCFFDSCLSCRVEEFAILRSRGLLLPGAVLVFHDTSPLRLEGISGGGKDAYAGIEKLREPGPDFEILEFPYSRGFILLRETHGAQASP